MNTAELFAFESKPQLLQPGEVLFRQGDPASELFVVLEGALEVTVNGRTVETSRRGAILGEMALIEQSPRTATVVATERSRLVRIDQKRFYELVQQNPLFAIHVMHSLVQRLRRNERAG
jgi:CRP-like cAMP-binding protein